MNGHYIKAESEVGNNFMVYDEIDDDAETDKDECSGREKTQRVKWSSNIVQPKGPQYSQHRPWRRMLCLLPHCNLVQSLLTRRTFRSGRTDCANFEEKETIP